MFYFAVVAFAALPVFVARTLETPPAASPDPISLDVGRFVNFALVINLFSEASSKFDAARTPSPADGAVIAFALVAMFATLLAAGMRVGVHWAQASDMINMWRVVEIIGACAALAAYGFGGHGIVGTPLAILSVCAAFYVVATSTEEYVERRRRPAREASLAPPRCPDSPRL